MKDANKKILIVEDDEDYADVLQKGFSGQGFFIILARDGQQGLDLALEEKPDLILMDILMPKMDGIEAARKIKEAGLGSPVIFLTNVKDLDSVSRAVEITQSDYIIKSDLRIEEIVKRAKEKLG